MKPSWRSALFWLFNCVTDTSKKWQMPHAITRTFFGDACSQHHSYDTNRYSWVRPYSCLRQLKHVWHLNRKKANSSIMECSPQKGTSVTKSFGKPFPRLRLFQAGEVTGSVWSWMDGGLMPSLCGVLLLKKIFISAGMFGRIEVIPQEQLRGEKRVKKNQRKRILETLYLSLFQWPPHRQTTVQSPHCNEWTWKHWRTKGRTVCF